MLTKRTPGASTACVFCWSDEFVATRRTCVPFKACTGDKRTEPGMTTSVSAEARDEGSPTATLTGSSHKHGVSSGSHASLISCVLVRDSRSRRSRCISSEYLASSDSATTPQLRVSSSCLVMAILRSQWRSRAMVSQSIRSARCSVI